MKKYHFYFTNSTAFSKLEELQNVLNVYHYNVGLYFDTIIIKEFVWNGMSCTTPGYEKCILYSCENAVINIQIVKRPLYLFMHLGHENITMMEIVFVFNIIYVIWVESNWNINNTWISQIALLMSGRNHHLG